MSPEWIRYRRGYYARLPIISTLRRTIRSGNWKRNLRRSCQLQTCHCTWAIAYFRLEGNKFFVPISLVVPGSQIPFVRSSDRDKATLDVIGMVLDNARHPLNQIRDTMKLAVSTSVDVQKKNVQYDTGMSLLSGRYHLKFVVRENQTGRMGSFRN